MVLEWSKAETGVGPSMAAGSHGWRPNWADFPAAARTRPSRGRVIFTFLERKKSCCISQELRFMASHVIAIISPMSPMRL